MHRVSSDQSATPQDRPAIAEVLRTCLHPSKLYLSIERVVRIRQKSDSNSDSDEHSSFATKLYLTDGDLIIQALLHHKLSTLPEIGDLKQGDNIEIRSYTVKTAPRRNNQGHVVYLGIEDCCVVKEERRSQAKLFKSHIKEVTQLGRSQSAKSPHVEAAAVTGLGGLSGGFPRTEEDGSILSGSKEMENKLNIILDTNIPQDTVKDVPEIRETHREVGVAERYSPDHSKSEAIDGTPISRSSRKRQQRSTESDEDDEDAFETMHPDLHSARKRRKALHNLSQNMVTFSSHPPSKDNTMARKRTVHFNLNPEWDEHEDEVKAAAEASSSTFRTRQTGSVQKSVSTPTDRKGSITLTNANSNIGLDTAASGPVTQTPDDPSPQWGLFHSLISLYSPALPSKSYLFTTLVIPTYTASHLISRPNSSFPPKRHIKVIDPSLLAKLNISKSTMLGKGITVSVYRNAQTFKPTIGRVALMRGVVMQRINSAMKNAAGHHEVILNVYPDKTQQQEGSALAEQRRITTDPVYLTDHLEPEYSHQVQHEKIGPGPGQQWFIDDPELLRSMGYRVDALQMWWDRMMSAR